MNQDYKRGYEKGFETALKYHGKEIVAGRIKSIKDEHCISGLSKGQVQVIKMQFERFNATPNQLAKHYKTSLAVMRKIYDGRLHKNINARGHKV